MSSRFFSKPAVPDEPASAEVTSPVPAAEPANDPTGQPEQEQEQAPGKMAELAGVLNNHKGKLAVGAAAMLGVAIFYKWRENRLAKEDPEEYARLRRLKKAIDSDAGPADEPTDTDKPA